MIREIERQDFQTTTWYEGPTDEDDFTAEDEEMDSLLDVEPDSNMRRILMLL